MAKVPLKAGAEVDFLTQEELRSVLEETAGRLYPPSPYRVRINSGGLLDGSGNGTFDILRSELGYVDTLTRLVVNANGFDWQTPYTTASSIEILRDGTVVDGYRIGGSSGGQIPTILTNNRAQAVYYQDGEVLQLKVTGGPASTGIVLNGHVWREPIPTTGG